MTLSSLFICSFLGIGSVENFYSDYKYIYKTCICFCQPLTDFCVSVRKSTGNGVLFGVDLPTWAMKTCSIATADNK